MDLGWLDVDFVKTGLKWGFWPFVGICAAVWQVERQFTKNRELKKEEHRDKMFLELHGEIDQIARDVSSKVSTPKGDVENLLLNVDFHVNPPDGMAWRPQINFNPKDFMRKHKEAGISVTKLIGKLESFEIIHPNLYIFRRAIGSAHYDLINAFPRLMPNIVRFDPDSGASLENLPLTQEYLAVLKKNVEAYSEASMDLTCFILDLRVELQNLLLGSLFDARVPARDPVDPRRKVIKLEPDSYVEQLETYFDNETQQGQANQRAEQDALAANAERLENE